MEKSKDLQASKSLRIQHYQSSFTTNTKGNSLGGKEKTIPRNKKIMNGKTPQQRQIYSKSRKSSTQNYEV